MNIVNLTPHAITVLEQWVEEWVEVATFPMHETGFFARVDYESHSAGQIIHEGHPELTIPLFGIETGSVRLYHLGTPNSDETTHGEGVTGEFPDPKEGWLFIVSCRVAAVLKDRDDLLVPFGMVRDDSGAVIGCQGFTRTPADCRGCAVVE